jgi:hypothetical protein
MKTENWKKTGLICWFERGIGGVCPSRRWQLNFCVLAVGLALLPLQAHPPHSHEDGRKIEFPDPPGYQTLVADLHQHTALSDGNVWPPIRVEEAARDGLDAISLTEHLEYLPHKKDIPYPDRNRSYQIANPLGKKNGVIVVNGSEITRDMPPGHANAIFLKDATKLVADDPVDAYREAGKQGAFIFWNHPNWIRQSKDATAKLSEMHKQLIAEGLIHGIEVVNDVTYSDDAIQIALDHNLTMMGNSDIHGLIDWQYDVPQGGHRPVTLVFAKEKTEAALKDALVNRRTVVWFKNTLIGRPEFLKPLLQASLSVKKAGYLKDSIVVAVEIENHSDANYVMENKSGFALYGNADLIQLAPHETTEIMVMTLKTLPAFDLKFKVWNAVTAPGEHPEISLKVEVK